MPARKTIDDVKQFLQDNDINHYCELLSDTYINNSTPLKFKCNVCGEIFERDFSHTRKSLFMCGKCALFLSGKKSKKFSLEYVQEYLNEHDLNRESELLSYEYKDTDKPLLFKCNVCGRLFTRSFSNLRKIRTGHYSCKKCGRIHIPKEQAIKDFNEHGFTVLGEYKNATTPVLCKCTQGHINYICHFWLSTYKFPCKNCRSINKSGENNINWSGGKDCPSIMYTTRSSINSWKREILKQYEFKCDISGTTETLEVHHLNINYKEVVLYAIKNLGLDYHKKANEYTIEQQLALKNEIAKIHKEKVKGVAIAKKYHVLFHQMYGKENNTEEQYTEFKKKIQGGIT